METVNNRVVTTENLENVEQAFQQVVNNLLGNEGSDTNTQNEEVIENSIELPLVPKNPQDIKVNEVTSRFSGADWATLVTKIPVTIAGLGGIGSFTAFLLSRVSPKGLYLYDDDKVELSNLSGQLYHSDDVGHYKVDCIVECINKYSKYFDNFTYTAKFTENTKGTPIMISGFDNMYSRKIFFNSWIQMVSETPIEARKECLFIDGRLAAENFQVFCMTGDDVYNHRCYSDEWLFTDEQAEQTVCSYKQTTYCAAMIGSIITNLFVNFVTNLTEPLLHRDLPFMTSYDAATMYFKTIN